MRKNYNVTTKIDDNSLYRFYGDIKYHDEMIAYAKMSKKFMNRPFNSPLDIVGNYQWHQEFKYEEYLLFDSNGNTKFPYVDLSNIKLVDWGCGPGRMIERMKQKFNFVDGIDISDYAIGYAREIYPNSKFFVSSGIDVGEAPEYYYDLVYSTIAMQHIPCRTIRQNILRGMYNILAPNGHISIQVAFNPTMQAGVWSPDTEHASYESDFFNAKATNGHADMIINNDALPLLQNDLEAIFDDVQFKFVNVDKLYA
ncbi:MAG: class I SAM-dependent methyltransferase, partial [Candidatus Paceibacterota bacterium]